jgi:hypothetical protein
MKKTLQLLVILFLSNSYSQVVFEKGYFINNQNEKIECWIKNQDWINQPKQIEYKLSEDGKTEITDFNQINSFQVYNTHHYYKKEVVNIDRETKIEGFNPKLETIILRVLVEGKATLFADISRSIYFYKIDNEDIKQLVYKKHADNDGKIIEDFSFRTELYNNLKCRDNSAEKLRKINYKQNSLVNYVIDFNECSNANYSEFNESKTKTEFNFKAFGGVNFYTMESIVTVGFFEDRPLKYKSSSNFNFMLGFEAEMLLPFHKNKWSIFIAPNYQSQQNQEFSTSPRDLYGGYNGTLSLEDSYSYLDLPLGLRHYFHINKNSKLFLGVAYKFIFIIDKTENRSYDPEINYGVPLRILDASRQTKGKQISIGYVYNNKYSLSGNYSTVQLPQSDIVAFSLQASYRFL